MNRPPVVFVLRTPTLHHTLLMKKLFLSLSSFILSFFFPSGSAGAIKFPLLAALLSAQPVEMLNRVMKMEKIWFTHQFLNMMVS